MKVIFYLYIASVLYYVFRSSNKGTFYLFSPLITVYLTFVFSNIYPLIICERIVPKSVVNVTIITCVIHMLFLFVYKRQWGLFIRLRPPLILREKTYMQSRWYIFIVFITLIVLSGFISGVTPALLVGGNVENLRRTSEIGLGFIQNIPLLGIPIILLTYFLIKGRNISIVQACFVALSVGLVVYMATASRRGIANALVVFLIWLNFAYRNFKWYEYLFLFYFVQPVIATFLSLIRSAQNISFEAFSFFAQEVMIFNANTLKLAEWIEESKTYLLGYSFYYDIVSIIPRFLWPDKPISIDYYYKNVVGYEFDGGGIYTTRDYDLYMNFGYFYIFPYILWLTVVHIMYACIIDKNSIYSTRIFCVVTFVSGFAIGALITRVELYLLFLTIFYIFNNKWKIV